MKSTLGLLALAALMYFGLQKEAPTPELQWQPYATSSKTGKLLWLWAGPYKTLDECNFNADKQAKNNADYRAPTGCLYTGYQNPYIQWIVNTTIGAGKFKCIGKATNRTAYNDTMYSPVLGDFPEDHGDNWKCAF